MYSCIHCPDVKTNRSSFNRHLKNHLTTDVGFLFTRIKEETDDVENCLTIPAWPLSLGGEDGKGEGMLDCEEPAASSEEVNDIMQRYEHLNISLVSEPRLPNSGESIRVTQSEEVSQQLVAEAEAGALTLEEREESMEDVKQELAGDKGESVKLQLSVDKSKETEGGSETPELSEARYPTEKKTKMGAPGDSQYSCQECDKTFSQKGSLQAHKIKHTAGGGRVQCEVCEKSFASKGSLLTHRQTHTGKKKYACKLCEESYNSRKDLTSHEKTIHSA